MALIALLVRITSVKGAMMGSDTEARVDAVEKAREHVNDVMHRQSDDPRSQQLIAQALREAQDTLHRAEDDLARSTNTD